MVWYAHLFQNFPQFIVIHIVKGFGIVNNAEIDDFVIFETATKYSKLDFSNMLTMNFQMFKLDLEKEEEPEIKLPTFVGSLKKQEFQKNIYFCFIDYAKAFDCADHKKL